MRPLTLHQTHLLLGCHPDNRLYFLGISHKKVKQDPPPLKVGQEKPASKRPSAFKGGAPTTFACVICARTFSTKIGLGVHFKSQHPAAANATVQIATKKARWSDEESEILASLEARISKDNGGLPPRNVNQQLFEGFPERTLDSIKSHRRSTKYKDMVKSALATIPSSAQTSPSGNTSIITIYDDEVQVGTTIPSTNVDDALVHQLSPVMEDIQPPSFITDLTLTLQVLCDDTSDSYHEDTLNCIIAMFLNDPTVNILDMLKEYLLAIYPKNRQTKGTFRTTISSENISNSQKRRTDFAEFQRLYKKNRSKAAQWALDGKTDDSNAIDPQIFADFWANIFGEEPPWSSPRNCIMNDEISPEALLPVTFKEISESFPAISSAAGPDGLTSRQIRAIPLRILAKVFNIFLIIADVPNFLKASRTTFIAKVNSPTLPSQFRPITVSSVLLRTLNKILATRLRKLTSLDARQRAFQPVDGCADNILCLNTIIRTAKSERRNLHLATIDLAKAFDSVSFEALHFYVKRAGIPDHLVKYVKNLYDDAHINFFFNGKENKVRARRGVKQGDPLSPFLFNCVVDGLLVALPKHIGFQIAEQTISAMAFADDLVLFASTKVGLQTLLDQTNAYFNSCGFIINVAKSSTLSIEAAGKQKKVKINPTPCFNIKEDLLPVITVGDTFKYLGVEFGPAGIHKSPGQAVDHLLTNLRKAPCKPQQRMFLLRTFLIPRLFHGLTLGRTTSTALEKLDRQIRAAIRSWLRLPHDVSTWFFHAPTSHGGLGIPAFRWTIPRLKLKRISKLEMSTIPVASDVFASRTIQKELRRANQWLWFRREGQDLQLLSASIYKSAIAKALYSSVDGKALKEAAKTPSASQWVSDGTRLLPGWEYIDLIRARINALPVAARTARGQPEKNSNCRAGCQRPETLNHIAGVCFRTHGLRVRRHNAIANTIGSRLSAKGWTVIAEPHLKTREGVRKPDLLLSRQIDGQPKTVVIDAQVVGTGMSLQECHMQKVNYYGKNPDVITQVKQTETDIPMFTSVTLNNVGIWSATSAKELQEIGLAKADLKIISIRAVQGTVSMFRSHQRMTGACLNRPRRGIG